MTRKNYAWKLGADVPELAPHSQAKHRIYGRYLERYIEILTASSAQEALNITIVDGYAGGGSYRLGSELVEGSPFILMKAVAAAEARLNASRSKGFRINARFYFVDTEADHCEFLKEEIRKSEFRDWLGQNVSVHVGDFNQLAPSIVDDIRKRQTAHRSIFFLDQNGWSQVAFQTVRTILADLKNPEIFLTFSVDALIDYLSEKNLDLAAFGVVDARPDFLRELVRIGEAQQAGWRVLIQNALYAHIQRETGAPHYSPFFIKTSEAHRAYWLLHLSKHHEARNEIGNIHWSETNASVHHGDAGFHALGFSQARDPNQLALGSVFDAPAREKSLRVVAEQVPQIVREGADTTNARPTIRELFVARCNDTPVTRSLLEEAVVRLRDAGELRIESKDGRDRPRATTISWEDKIVVPPQRTFWGPVTGFLPQKRDD